MMSAVTVAAMTSGRLSAILRPIGQMSFESWGLVAAFADELMLEGRPLGFRADHADLGQVIALQRRRDDQEIQRMVMGQHDHRASRRKPSHQAFGQGGQMPFRACRREIQLVGPRFRHMNLDRQQ
jgi:hypothetical protein